MSLLDRRSIVTGIAAMIAGPLVAPVARAMQADVISPKDGLDVVHPIFTPDLRALTAAISERIVPTTDTPGAIAAGVPAFIEMMLADWHTPEERELITKGMNDVDAFALKTYGKPFVKIDAKRQDAILTLAMQGALPGRGDKTLPGIASDFFEHLRQMVIYGYYSSEIGCTVERIYLPVPGRYDGAYPYAEVKRVFAS